MLAAARSQVTPWFSRVGTSVARSGCHRRLASSRVSPAYRAASTWAAASSSLKRGAKLLGDSQSPTVTVPPSCRAAAGGAGRGEMGVTEVWLLHATSPSASHARIAVEIRRSAGALELVEDLPPLALELGVRDGALLLEPGELLDVGEQVDEGGVQTLSDVDIGGAPELGRTRVPGLQVEERLQRGVRDAQGLDLVALKREQAQLDAVPGVQELAVQVALEHLTVLE